MGETGTITARILEALVEAGLVTAEQSASLETAAEERGVSAGEILAERGLVEETDLYTMLEYGLGIPRVDLASYAPDDEALELLSPALAHRLNVLPLFEIEGMLTVAVGSPFDVFKLDTVREDLSLEIEAVLADAASVSEAIEQHYPGGAAEEPAAEEPVEEPTAEEPAEPDAEAAEAADAEEAAQPAEPAEPVEPAAEDELDAGDFFEAPAHETPVAAEPSMAPDYEEEPAEPAAPVETLEQVVETVAGEGPAEIDLDVLAVADAAKVSVLVADILKHAVEHGAARIHLLPYKDDFFLVYRVAGRLEKIASAPLSMQEALVDGFKNFARLGGVSSRMPAIGRQKARIADHDLIVSVSAVPTIAGQRVVISFASAAESPRTLTQLGMSQAETFALNAMVERGRGILLVCAPVAGGRSTTYYSLLSHAAASGRTVYSVERSVEYEIPAVAQVLVNPASPVSAAAYFAAGMRQDTDVVAIDSLESVEDVHLAVEAAGLGKLVIATFSAGGIVAGVARMLAMGAEPVSLSAALTLGVGQRLVRLSCQSCIQEEPGKLASKIPGAPTGTVSVHGAGCPACATTGFAGATGVFEVLPFTDPVRSVISRGVSADDIAAAANAAGMRPMAASGLAKVQEGIVSAAELNRVLRFAE